MFRIDLLQSQWTWASLAGGLLFVLMVVLTYLAIWRVPPTAGRKPMPWILILTYVAMGLFVVAYTLAMVFHPPNW
jgi:hypothetical protein